MFVSCDKLTLLERDLCQVLLRDIAQRMLSTLSDDTRSKMGVHELTIYDLATTSFEQAFTVLKNAGLLKPVYPDFFSDDQRKAGTPYGRLHVQIEDISKWLEKNAPESRPYLEEIIDAYVNLFCDYDELSTTREWFTVTKKFEHAMTMLSKNGYVSVNKSEYRWSDKIALPMWRSACWDTDAGTDTEKRLLDPLIEELTTNIPDYVSQAIDQEITREKDLNANRKFQSQKYSIALERVINRHYRFETWMPYAQAQLYPHPEYWNGVTRKLIRSLAAIYATD